jgi:hypothetical protein
MRSSIWVGTLAMALLPAVAAGQVDSAMMARARVLTRALQIDTTTLRIRRPVSRVVLETAWAAADTQQRQAATMVVRRPAWTSQAALYQRLIRQVPTDPWPRIRVTARKIPRPIARAPTLAEDSTLLRQAAPDFRVRAEAIARIQTTPVARLHPAIASNMIDELDSVGAVHLATAPAPAPESLEEQEAYPEYVISLARSVGRLKDPRSVRALTLGGLVVSREIQRFVASQGPAALGALDTAFSASDATAPAVVNTWGYALAADPSRLTFDDSVYVYARIVLSAQYYPVSFAQVVRQTNLFELIPELESIAAGAADSQPVAAAVSRAAIRHLTPVRESARPADWLARLRLRTGVVCMEGTKLGPEVCRALLGATSDAARSLGNLDQTRQAMTRYNELLDGAVAAQLMSAQARGSLSELTTGLLRASGDRRTGPPGARIDLHHLPIRRGP